MVTGAMMTRDNTGHDRRHIKIFPQPVCTLPDTVMHE